MKTRRIIEYDLGVCGVRCPYHSLTKVSFVDDDTRFGCIHPKTKDHSIIKFKEEDGFPKNCPLREEQ